MNSTKCFEQDLADADRKKDFIPFIKKYLFLIDNGIYIVIEGHDGTGKSSQVKKVITWLKNNFDIDCAEFHEPAGSDMANGIRDLLKNGNIERDPMTNVLLFTAARCDTWKQIAEPALAHGKWAIAARNFYSTLAYQCFGEGIDIEKVLNITKTSTSSRYYTPDVAIILTIKDESERQKRIMKRGELDKPDTFESKPDDFQEQVRKGYKEISKMFKTEIVSADNNIDKVFEDIIDIIIKNIIKIIKEKKNSAQF